MDPVADDRSAMSQKDAPVAARDRSRAEDHASSPSPGSEGAGQSALGTNPPAEQREESDCPAHSALADGPGGATAGTRRWWAVVVVTSVFSLPFGWLLSFAALLPFYLGLFFFALFGLVIGAVACRMATPAAPFPRLAVTVGTTMIIASCWLTSIVTECLDFPRSMTEKAVAGASTIGDAGLDSFRQSVEEASREIIRNEPGGPILGYVRWVVTNGHVKANTFPGVRRSLRPIHRRQGWVIRVLISITLLSFGIATQTWPLRDGGDGRQLQPAPAE